MNKQIYLDMDGVIVDLHCPLKYASSEQITSFYRGELFDFSKEELWGTTDADWWANLPWTVEGRRIVEVCERAVGQENVIICTKPADWSGSAEGKLRWIDREMPDYRRRFILTPQKHWVANSRSLLVDDNDENVKFYRAAFGPALLVPRPWNENRNWVGRTVEYIAMMLEEMA